MKKFLIILCLSFTSPAALASNLDPEYLEFIKDMFNEIQPITFINNREYCGYIGINEDDELVTTPATMGEENSCLANDPPKSLELIGSYHTHGGFSVEADSELPSSNDMEADIAEGVDGFIATPGGRIWYIDSLNGVATMECGRNCIMSDPKFNAMLLDPVQFSYTLRGLKRREASQ